MAGAINTVTTKGQAWCDHCVCVWGGGGGGGGGGSVCIIMRKFVVLFVVDMTSMQILTVTEVICMSFDACKY